MEGFSKLLEGFIVFRWEFLVMYAIGGVLISLAIKKDYEPMLLLPIGFGAILVNLPLNVIWGSAAEPGALLLLYNSGILTGIVPAADLCRHRRDDGFPAAVFNPAHDLLRRGGAIRHLLHDPRGAGNRRGVSSARLRSVHLGVHRHHRRRRRPDLR